MKELPLPAKGERWWGTPEKVSDRLKVEFEAMRDLFKKREPVSIKLPVSNWDVSEILIFTHSLQFKMIEGDSNYGSRWIVKFSMDDNDHLCKPTDIYTMHIFYPKDYPFKSPDIALEKNGESLTGKDHNLSAETIEGKNYNRICHIIHSSTNFLQGHDPAKTNTAMHALRGILWLRSQQEAAKDNRSSMLEYA